MLKGFNMIILVVAFFCLVKSESVLKSYGLESPAIEIHPKESTFQDAFFKVFRDKRSATYKVLESPGLTSHFQIDDMHLKEMLKRNKRNVKDVKEDKTLELPQELPNPEKQVMLNEQWPKNPYINDYQSKIDKDDMDIDAEASQFGDGIKARVPRVNFITQQTKASSEVIPELYRKPLEKVYYDYPQRSLDSPHRSSPPVYSKSFDPYYRDMIHPPPPYRYDYPYYYNNPENPKNPYYYSHHENPKNPYYYYYPDRRYDLPNFRPSYSKTNELYDNQQQLKQTTWWPKNRRIIYYAHLPEVVRTPPNYYNYYDNQQRYDPFYYQPTPTPMTGTYERYRDRIPIDNTKNDKYQNSTPSKINRDVVTSIPPQADSRSRFSELKNLQNNIGDYYDRHH